MQARQKFTFYWFWWLIYVIGPLAKYGTDVSKRVRFKLGILGFDNQCNVEVSTISVAVRKQTDICVHNPQRSAPSFIQPWQITNLLTGHWTYMHGIQVYWILELFTYSDIPVMLVVLSVSWMCCCEAMHLHSKWRDVYYCEQWESSSKIMKINSVLSYSGITHMAGWQMHKLYKIQRSKDANIVWAYDKTSSKI